MKRLLTSFFLYLEQFNTDEASVDFSMDITSIDWWDEKVWINVLRKDVKIPSNFLPLFDMIIENILRLVLMLLFVVFNYAIFMLLLILLKKNENTMFY